MAAYIARRLILAVFTIWVISVLTFVIIELPEGDAAERTISQLMMGGGVHGHVGNAELIVHLRAYMDLDKPQYIRYIKWIWRMLHGDLGFAYTAGEASGYQGTIKKIIGDRLWLTVALTSFTIMVTWTFAIPVGIYSAVRQHSVGDYTFTLLGFTGLAVPDFLLGLVLMYIAYAYFDQSVGGLFSADYANADWSLAKVYDLIQHLWIPAVVLGTSGTAGLIRVMRNNLLDELAKPLRGNGTRQGRGLLKADNQVPVARRHQPAHQHRGLPAALARQRKRDRVRGPQPAYPGTRAPHSHTAGGHERCGIHHPDAGSADRHWHTGLRPSPRRRRPAHQAHGIASGSSG